MKVKKNDSVWSTQIDSELNHLPEKVVKVDDEIQVLVREVSRNHNDYGSSLEMVRNSHPDWLNESSLVLAGSPNKNKNSSLKCNNKKEKMKSAENEPRKLNKVSSHSNSKTKVIVDETHVVNSSPVYNSNGHCNVSSVSTKMGTIPNSQFSDGSSSPDGSDLTSFKCDIARSSKCEKSSYNLPDNTYLLSKCIKQENVTDFNTEITNDLCDNEQSSFIPGVTKFELAEQEYDLESHLSSPSCSVTDSFSSSNEDSDGKKYNHCTKRDMKQLYESLKEIPWAQNWNPSSIMGHTIATRLSKKRLLKPKSPNKPSTFVKNRIMRNITVKAQRSSKLGLSAVSKKGEATLISKKKTQISNKKKLKRKCLKQKNNSSVDVKGNSNSIKCNGAVNNNKKGLAIRYDFNKPKPSVKSDSKRKNVTNKSVFTNNTTIKVADCKKAKLPELKIKLEPVDGKAYRVNKAGFFKVRENFQNSKVSSNTVLPCHMDNILQRHINQTLQSKLWYNEFKTETFKKPRLDDDAVRLSTRHTEGAFRYKEIAVKKQKGFIQIILIPNMDKRNGLTVEALLEIKDALIAADKDSSCKLVLLNSSGSVFCCGVDLGPLIGPDKLVMSERLAVAIRDLVKVLAFFKKPLVAAVNGDTVGFGVALLTYCDVVFASDKAMFYTPYAKIGYIPEAALTLVLPQAVGTIVSSDMLLRGHKLTAQEARLCGLVSEVLWPTLLMEEVIPRIREIITQPLQAMELTKMMLRSNQLERLKFTLENETRLLPKQWLSPVCQKAIKEVVKQGGYFMFN